MKSNEEFTNNVLEKAGKIMEKRRNTKNIIVKAGAGVLAFVFVFMGAFGIAYENTPTTEVMSDTSTTVSSVKSSGFLLVASAADGESQSFDASRKAVNIELPYGGFIDITNTKGMSESAKNKISYNIKKQLEATYGTDKGWRVRGSFINDKAIYLATVGSLNLVLTESDIVSNVEISCGENGNLQILDTDYVGMGMVDRIKVGKSVKVTAEEYENIYNTGEGMPIKWELSENINNEIAENSEINFSEINDTILFKVNYTDGTSKNFEVTINFDEDGNFIALYSYENA